MTTTAMDVEATQVGGMIVLINMLLHQQPPKVWLKLL